MPGGAARNGWIGGLLIAVQLADFPVGRFDEQHRNTERLEACCITATAGAGRVFRIQSGIRAQIDPQFLCDTKRLLAYGRQGGVIDAVGTGMGIHQVARDQAVEVDHAEQAGPLAIAQAGYIGA